MSEVECIIPVFQVSDIKQSADFYVESLGFQVDWDTGTICSVSRDDHCLMLSQQGETLSPAMAWMGLETDALFQQCIDNGVKIVQPPVNETWASCMKICDPDDNILWLGSAPRSDEYQRAL